MFKRFTERARRVIILAREEAELYRHEYLGTEHILQGIIKDGGGIAIAIVQKSGVDMTQLKKELEKNLPRSSNSLIIGIFLSPPEQRKFWSSRWRRPGL